MTKVLATTKLEIRNQAGLLNQIAAVYASFMRAAMEYIDNAVDAATGRRLEDASFRGRIDITVDLKARTVVFRDDCGGMSPQQLCALLSSVGESSKRSAPWANGQFGFGVHAFRGFARYAVVTSHKKGYEPGQVTIDREADQSVEISCVSVPPRNCPEGTTIVRIEGFDAHHFRKNQFLAALVAEIERHFDDVLRSGLVEIFISTPDTKPFRIESFNYDALPGVGLKCDIPVVKDDREIGRIGVDVKLLENLHEGRSVILTNKGRRVQAVGELRSYKRYASGIGRSVSVWANHFLTGSIEIHDLVSPTLTRDDLKETANLAPVYAAVMEVQLQVEELVRQRNEERAAKAYEEVASRATDCLAEVLRRYKIRFEDATGIGSSGSTGFREGDLQAFGGSEPGGGGPGGDGIGSGGTKWDGGSSGPGSADTGAGKDGNGTAEPDPGRKGTSSGRGFPTIEFQEYPQEPLRVVLFGATLQINVSHPDFVVRQSDAAAPQRLTAYVAQVIAGPCVEYAFARKGKAITAPAILLEQATDIALLLEESLLAAGVLDEVLV